MYVCCSEQGFRLSHKIRDNENGKDILMNGENYRVYEVNKSGKEAWGMERKGGS